MFPLSLGEDGDAHQSYSMLSAFVLGGAPGEDDTLFFFSSSPALRNCNDPHALPLATCDQGIEVSAFLSLVLGKQPENGVLW